MTTCFLVLFIGLVLLAWGLQPRASVRENLSRLMGQTTTGLSPTVLMGTSMFVVGNARPRLAINRQLQTHHLLWDRTLLPITNSQFPIPQPNSYIIWCKWSFKIGVNDYDRSNRKL